VFANDVDEQGAMATTPMAAPDMHELAPGPGAAGEPARSHGPPMCMAVSRSGRSQGSID
jgi:hypothetical protein